MPEGDTIYRMALALHQALAGRTVTRFRSMLPALTRVDVDRPLAGRAIQSVDARGKHLLMTFSGDLILHTHLRMNGSWQLYRPRERWRRPLRDMRVVIETADVLAVGFNLQIAEFLTSRTLLRHPDLVELGPDLVDPSFDAAEAGRRMRTRQHQPVGEVLLDQRVMSGIGNVLKSEVLFVARINPFTAVSDLKDEDLEQLIGVSKRLMSMNVPASERVGRSTVFGRRTRNSLDPSARLWVYGRGGKPCRSCGAPIEGRKSGPDARITYWCPKCQPQRGKNAK